MKNILFPVWIFMFLFLLPSKSLFAQSETPSPFSLSAYVDLYYSYDFNRPLTNKRPPFLYNFNRNHNLNVNLAFIKGAYLSDRLRANLALALGSYVKANYTAEPGFLKNLYEANIGVKLLPKSNFWLDAGIFSSHIGWETAVCKDNLTLSPSMAAENSPYYETGARVSYTSENQRWYASALLLNGWQRIKWVNGHTTPSFGTQITFKPSSTLTFNSSSYIGNDKPDSLRKMRYFHDLYGIFQLSHTCTAILGFDIGAEQKTKGSRDYNIWYTTALLFKYVATSKLSLAARAEYFNDKNGVIIALTVPKGFRVWGFSANVDYSILSDLMWRLELRTLNSKDDIFYNHDNQSLGHDIALSSTLAFSF